MDIKQIIHRAKYKIHVLHFSRSRGYWCNRRAFISEYNWELLNMYFGKKEKKFNNKYSRHYLENENKTTTKIR
jgi:hypothetical protein